MLLVTLAFFWTREHMALERTRLANRNGGRCTVQILRCEEINLYEGNSSRQWSKIRKTRCPAMIEAACCDPGHLPAFHPVRDRKKGRNEKSARE